MVEINLLPWREYLRIKRLSLQKIYLIVGIIVFLLVVVSVSFILRGQSGDADKNIIPAVSEQEQSNLDLIQQLQKIKFVGYLHDATHWWGIVVLVNGDVRDVHVGSEIQGNVRVSSLSESQLVLQLANKFSIKIPFSHE